MPFDGIHELHTGDLILFSGDEIISRAIQLATDSKYTHVGMVIIVDKDHPLNGLRAGVYLLESIFNQTAEDAELQKSNADGVQLTVLEHRIKTYNGNVYCRHLDLERDAALWEKLNYIYDLIRGAPFNSSPQDWATTGFFPSLQKNNIPNKFFCSALVGFMYTNLGIFHSYTEWYNFRPKDFGQEHGSRFPLMKKGYLGPAKIIKLHTVDHSKKMLCCCKCIIS